MLLGVWEGQAALLAAARVALSLVTVDAPLFLLETWVGISVFGR
jgi:hypothetical protein